MIPSAWPAFPLVGVAYITFFVALTPLGNKAATYIWKFCALGLSVGSAYWTKFLPNDKFIVSEVTFVPNNYMELDEESTEKVINLIDALNDLDDVQNVYHNLDI